MTVFGLKLQCYVRGREGEDALQELRFAFERTGELLEDFGTRYFPRLTGLLEEEIGGQFLAEGRGPNRGSWPALSPAYEESKRKMVGVKRKLVRTGAMLAALTRSSSPNALRTAAGGDRFEFGTRGLPYAQLHQTGTRHMPDRPPMDFRPELEESMKREGMALFREMAREAELDRLAKIS